MNIDEYHDIVTQRLDAQLETLRRAIAISRQENDLHTYSFLSHRADGVRDALEAVRRVYAEHGRVAA
jgi:hypothetical protein